MGTPFEDAKAVALSTYSLFYELIGKTDQEKPYERVWNVSRSDDRSVTIEDDFNIGDDIFRLLITSRSDGNICHVTISLPNNEFESFQVKSDAVQNTPNFKKGTAPKLEPMIRHINSLLNS